MFRLRLSRTLDRLLRRSATQTCYRVLVMAVVVFTVPARVGAQRVLTEGPREPVRETISCELTRIVDGDTIECRRVGRVRLIGMDTPEAGQEPYGEMATEAVRALVKDATTVARWPTSGPTTTW
jgi:endonuclease YncB( thermonuclease family)